MAKPKIRVSVSKNGKDDYDVIQFNFDTNGNTIFHKVHGSGLTWREAQELKKRVLADWVG